MIVTTEQTGKPKKKNCFLLGSSTVWGGIRNGVWIDCLAPFGSAKSVRTNYQALDTGGWASVGGYRLVSWCSTCTTICWPGIPKGCELSTIDLSVTTPPQSIGVIVEESLVDVAKDTFSPFLLLLCGIVTPFPIHVHLKHIVWEDSSPITERGCLYLFFLQWGSSSGLGKKNLGGRDR